MALKSKLNQRLVPVGRQGSGTVSIVSDNKTGGETATYTNQKGQTTSSSSGGGAAIPNVSTANPINTGSSNAYGNLIANPYSPEKSTDLGMTKLPQEAIDSRGGVSTLKESAMIPAGYSKNRITGSIEKNPTLLQSAGEGALAAVTWGIAGLAEMAISSTASSAIGKAAAGASVKNAIEFEVGTSAKRIAVNTVNAAKTTSFLTKVASTAKNPMFVASTIVGAIGSYPFAGFIKEEALQTLGFGINVARQNGDIEGAKKALEQTKEVLNPDVWSKILNAIPYANVLANLKDFYEAATTKLEIDAKNIEEMQTKQSADVNDAGNWDKIYEENKTRREQERIEEADYYAQIATQQKQAKEQGRAEDEAYWNGIYEEAAARTAEKEKAWLKWLADYQKWKDENTSSHLSFGGLFK